MKGFLISFGHAGPKLPLLEFPVEVFLVGDYPSIADVIHPEIQLLLPIRTIFKFHVGRLVLSDQTDRIISVAN
jgi:hypothetical protein